MLELPLKVPNGLRITFARSSVAEAPRFPASKGAMHNCGCVITDEEDGN